MGLFEADEKEEIKQVSSRIFREQSSTLIKDNSKYDPSDKTGNRLSETDMQKEQKYDWANIDEKQASDRRNFEEVVEDVSDTYKVNVEKALQAGE
jgi:thymidine kinase